MLVGITYISASMKKKILNRHTAVLTGLAFLQEYGRKGKNEHVRLMRQCLFLFWFE